MLQTGLTVLARHGLCRVPGHALLEHAAASSLLLSGSTRSYAAQAQPSAEPGEKGDKPETIGNDKVRQLADEIMGLTVLECSWLSEILRKKLGVQQPTFSAPMAMPFMPGAAPAAGAAGAPAAAAAAEKKEEPKKEKTEFDVKLESFSAEGKIKVIKEVRALTSLGLKEAKELVSTPRHWGVNRAATGGPLAVCTLTTVAAW